MLPPLPPGPSPASLFRIMVALLRAAAAAAAVWGLIMPFSHHLMRTIEKGISESDLARKGKGARMIPMKNDRVAPGVVVGKRTAIRRIPLHIL